MVVVVHSKISLASRGLIQRVISVLNEHVTKTILASVRDIEQFSNGGMLQVVADVEFLRKNLSKYRTADIQNAVHLIYSTLKDSAVNITSWDSSQGPKPYVQKLVDEALEASSVSIWLLQVQRNL